MENMDMVKDMDTLKNEFFNALQGDDENAQKEAFKNYTEGLQKAIMVQAESYLKIQAENNADEKALVQRGILRPLTTEEKKYFNAVIEKQTFTNLDLAFPKTIIQDVFAKLREQRPLLAKIDTMNTEILTQFIYAKSTTATAFWGQICSDIKQMILEGFNVVNVQAAKLSGFVPICKGMLELGPNWLAEYVITLITEIMSYTLELGIVQGTGKDQPIGMMKKLSGAVDGVYQDKPTIALTALDAKSLVGVRAALAKSKNDSANVSIIVNPETYWAKLFSNLVIRNANGEFIYDKLATGETIIQSYAVPKDKLIVGDPKNYILMVSGNMRIDKYEETLAIEDATLYIAKMYANGMAKNKDAFFVVDITGVKGVDVPALEVETPGV